MRLDPPSQPIDPQSTQFNQPSAEDDLHPHTGFHNNCNWLYDSNSSDISATPGSNSPLPLNRTCTSPLPSNPSNHSTTATLPQGPSTSSVPLFLLQEAVGAGTGRAPRDRRASGTCTRSRPLLGLLLQSSNPDAANLYLHEHSILQVGGVCFWFDLRCVLCVVCFWLGVRDECPVHARVQQRFCQGR